MTNLPILRSFGYLIVAATVAVLVSRPLAITAVAVPALLMGRRLWRR